MKNLSRIAVLTIFLLSSLLAGCGGGVGNDDNPCQVPSDHASDGSLCGDRAASVKPGGK
jgi:hypothetical protein